MVSEKSLEDPFLWLEEIEGDTALDWVRARNAETEEALKSSPLFERLGREALEILNATDRIPYGALRDGQVFNFWQDDENVRGLWRRASLESYVKARPDWETLLDFDALAETENENWVFKGSNCLPPAYTHCLLRLSRGGKDAAVQREFDVTTKAFVAEGFAIPEAKSGIAWETEDSVWIGTDWGPGALTASGYPRVIKRLARGQALSEAQTLFEGNETDVGIWPAALSGPGFRRMLIVQSLNFFESAYWVETDAGLKKLPLPPRVELEAVLNGELFITLQQAWQAPGAPEPFDNGAVVSLDLEAFLAAPETRPLPRLVYAPGPRTAVQQVAVAGQTLLLSLTDEVIGRVLRGVKSEALGGAPGEWSFLPVPLPENSTVSLLDTSPYEETAFLNFENPVTPDSLAALDAGTGEYQVIRQLPDRFKTEGLGVTKYEAVSADGTRVPYFVLAPEDGGPVPTLMVGYGGFQIPLRPSYAAVTGKLWAERGGAYVIANIRGGGEFGPTWHEAARKINRQRSFDDFIAVAEDLIARGLTSPDQLAISGGSNGGLLTGAVMVQRPDLFGAVISKVPLFDMLRYPELLAGASWVGEYGDPDVPEERAALLAYSPYHNVAQEASYPPMLVITSTKDDRVHPGHARKMVARLKEQGHEVHYFEALDGGHSAAANRAEQAQRLALEYAFLAEKLGLSAKTAGN